MLLTYFLNDFEIVPVAPVIIGITFAFYIPHSIVRSLYFRSLMASFLITFLSPDIATSINIHVPFSFIIIIIIIIIAIEFSLGGSSPYTSTDKTNKNKYNKRNNTKNKVQPIQNTVNTSTHITKTPTHTQTHTSQNKLKQPQHKIHTK